MSGPDEWVLNAYEQRSAPSRQRTATVPVKGWGRFVNR